MIFDFAFTQLLAASGPLAHLLTYAAPHRQPVDSWVAPSLYILLLIALPAAAQIYKYTDANGQHGLQRSPPTAYRRSSVELPLPPQSRRVASAERTPAPVSDNANLSATPTTSSNSPGCPPKKPFCARTTALTVNVLISPRM